MTSARWKCADAATVNFVSFAPWFATGQDTVLILSIYRVICGSRTDERIPIPIYDEAIHTRSLPWGLMVLSDLSHSLYQGRTMCSLVFRLGRCHSIFEQVDVAQPISSLVSGLLARV